MVFELVDIGDSKATMVHRPILAPELKVEVPFEELPQWKISKAKMPEMYPANQAKNVLPQAVLFCKEEFAKMQATLALHEAMKGNQVSYSQVAFAKNPAVCLLWRPSRKAKGLNWSPWEIWSNPKVTFPRVPSQCNMVASPGTSTLGSNSMIGKSSHSHRNAWVPFWWCKPAEEDYNMELSTITVQTMGLAFKVPCLTNKDKIDANQLLTYQKPEEEEEQTEDQGSQPSQPPKKKKKI